MTKRIFELEIDLKSAKAKQELEKFNNTVDDTNKKTKDNKKATDDSSKGFKGLTAKLGPATAGFAAVGVAVTAAVGAFVALDGIARQTATNVNELQNLARVAGTTVQQFQAMAFAAQGFGISQDKVADIIQDFNDKLGDFTIAGAGPFVDVLAVLGDQAGITSESLSKMSGREGIQAITNALQTANIPLKEQTTLLEALASDLSRAAPLFRENGAAIDEANDKLKENNALLTDLQISRLTEYKKQVDLLDKQYEALANTVASKSVPALQAVNDIISDFLGFVNKPSEFEVLIKDQKPKEAIETLTKRLEDFEAAKTRINNESNLLGSASAFGGTSTKQQLKAVDDQIAAANELIQVQKNLMKVSNETAAADAKNKEDAVVASNRNSSKVVTDAQKAQAAIESQIASLSSGKITIDELNESIRTTAELEKLIAPFKEKFNAEQLKEIEAQFKSLIGAQTQLTQVQKDSEDAQALLKKTEEDRLALQKERNSTFAGEITGLTQELALLKEQDVAKRELLKTEMQIKGLGLNADQTGYLLSLQNQIDAQRKLNDTKEKTAEINKSFDEELKGLEERLVLSGLNNDAARERQQLEFELANSGYSDQQKDSIRVVNDQIIAQERRNALLQEEKDAVQSLGQAIGSWAGGSKDAIKSVIAELIRLIAITQFGGTGNLLGGFLSGVGGGNMRGFAKGGNFNAGETFVVGEAGPEIITSNAAGAVIPNGQAFGNKGTSLVLQPTLTVNGSVMNTDELSNLFSDFSNSIAQQTQALIKNELRPQGVFS